jgi:hypothetical protein
MASEADGGGTEFVGSHEKADDGYGQNGFPGPASDVPGKHTTSGFLPKTVLPSQDPIGQDRLEARVKVDGDGKAIPYPPAAASMANRGVDTGSPGGPIPNVLNHSPKR